VKKSGIGILPMGHGLEARATEICDTFEHFVIPSYAYLDIVLERGEGSYVWDADVRRYLDFGGGIAVCALGHANPEIADALNKQSRNSFTFPIYIIMSHRDGWRSESSI
jgi:acetylornithine/succinyldiaminopimelate/putrescine aminotransferase